MFGIVAEIGRRRALHERDRHAPRPHPGRNRGVKAKALLSVALQHVARHVDDQGRLAHLTTAGLSRTIALGRRG